MASRAALRKLLRTKGEDCMVIDRDKGNGVPGAFPLATSAWLPALEGVVAKLETGARVADVGCGQGASTILLAKAFPRSSFLGFDSDGASVDQARTAAAEAAVVH